MELHERARGDQLEREVAIADGIERVMRDLGEAERVRRVLPIDRMRRRGERARTERGLVGAKRSVGDAAAIAIEHALVGEQVMREPHRLRALEVRVTGHQRLDVIARLREQRAAKLVDAIDQTLRGRARVEPQVGRDLIVAAACGVEAATGIADLVDEPRLDVHVHVLERVVPRELSRREPRLDAPQAVRDRVGVACRDDAARGKHLGVCDRAGDVVREEPMIEVDRRVHRSCGRIECAVESPSASAFGAVCRVHLRREYPSLRPAHPSRRRIHPYVREAVRTDG